MTIPIRESRDVTDRLTSGCYRLARPTVHPSAPVSARRLSGRGRAPPCPSHACAIFHPWGPGTPRCGTCAALPTYGDAPFGRGAVRAIVSNGDLRPGCTGSGTPSPKHWRQPNGGRYCAGMTTNRFQTEGGPALLIGGPVIARFLGVAARLLPKLVREKGLPVTKYGAHLTASPGQLVQWVEKRAVSGEGVARG